MSHFECKYCGALRKVETICRVDAQQSIKEIEYECGTKLIIEFPVGEFDWQIYCSGSSSQRLDNNRKLPDK